MTARRDVWYGSLGGENVGVDEITPGKMTKAAAANSGSEAIGRLPEKVCSWAWWQ